VSARVALQSVTTSSRPDLEVEANAAFREDNLWVEQGASH